MVQARADRRRRTIAFALLLSGPTLLLAGVGEGPANADVASVSGGAFGASANGTIFGNPFALAPTPTVTLPPAGATPPLTATVASGSLPPVLPETGTLNVSTQGTVGPAGSATSSASAANLVFGPINEWAVSSTCTASETGVTGSTTVTGGVIALIDPDDAVSGEPGEVTQTVPANPPPNTTYTGQVANVDDNYTLIFNEQVVGTDSIVVNAVHMKLSGPIAFGDVIIGHSECGVTPATAPTTAPPTPTTAPPTPTTAPPTPTTAPTTATTTAPGGGGGGGGDGGPRVVGQALARTGAGLGGLVTIAWAALSFGLGARVLASRPRRTRRR